MKITIHRGTHQIGGVSTEISTEKSRIIIDMGDELSVDTDFVSQPFKIDGVTNKNGKCDGVLFSHYHGDHIGQMMSIREDIPLFSGTLAKKIMQKSEERKRPVNHALCQRIKSMRTFKGGDTFVLGDIKITPYSVDHSACDSYMFLIESEGKRILHTGDFRMHGFRGKALPKILRMIGKVDAVITEGTTLSRSGEGVVTERELQKKAREYMEKYKYVFLLCSATNVERICAFSKAVPRGKYFVCDEYQRELIELLEKHWQGYSPLYKNVKKTVYGENILPKLQKKGFLMAVRDNESFRAIISKFNREESIILYSMWDGYKSKADSTIPDFLSLASVWAPLHTSGHASRDDIRLLLSIAEPDTVIPMHTDNPNKIKELYPNDRVRLLNDGEVMTI